MARRLAAAFALLLYLLLAVLLFASAWQAPLQRAIGYGPDPELVSWLLRWTPFALSHGLNPFVTDYVDYPTGVNLMWNALLPLPGVLLSPLTLTLGPLIAYNTLVTLGLALSRFSAYIAISRYVRNTVAAFSGGLLYAFSPYMVAQSLGHPHVSVAFIPPLILIVLDEILVRQRRRASIAGAVLGLLGLAQLLLGEELLATEAVVAVLGIVLLYALNRQAVTPRAPHAFRALGIAVATFVLLSAFPLAIQFFGPQQVQGTLQPRGVFVSDLLSFVTPTRLQLLIPPAIIPFSDNLSLYRSEANAYLGIPLIALLVYTAVRFRGSGLVRVVSLLALLLVLLSMGPLLHAGGVETTIPMALLALPLLAFNRVLPGRLMLYAYLTLWTALAFASGQGRHPAGGRSL